MSTSEHPWVDVAWDAVQPGDRVLSPDGATEFHVTARIDFPDDPEINFLLSQVGPDGPDEVEEYWTDRPRGERVQGWRFTHQSSLPGAEAFAVGRLRLAGFDVTVLSD